jgi:uncharacterized protein YyaL (SSP411 family)
MLLLLYPLLQASTIMGQLEQFTSSPPASPGEAAAVDPKQLLAAVHGCAKSLMKGYDPKLGGFGGPPKFPRPSEVNLLLRAATEQVTVDPVDRLASRAKRTVCFGDVLRPTLSG